MSVRNNRLTILDNQNPFLEIWISENDSIYEMEFQNSSVQDFVYNVKQQTPADQ